MTPLEFLFAIGITVAILSIILDIYPILYFGIGILLLVVVQVEIWGFNLLLAGFFIAAAGMIRVVGMFVLDMMDGDYDTDNNGLAVAEIVYDLFLADRDAPPEDEFGDRGQ